jgi:hypothetical protein
VATPPAPAPPAAAQVTLRLESAPPGATVRVGTELAGKTPIAFTTRAQAEAVGVTFSLDGFQSETIQAIPSDGLKVFAHLTPAKRKGGKKAPVTAPPLEDIKSER